jgi:hypothetical protein
VGQAGSAGGGIRTDDGQALVADFGIGLAASKRTRQLPAAPPLRCFVLGSRADISRGPDVLVPPGVFVVPLEQAGTLDWARMRELLLVAEMLSPSSVRHDGFIKRRRYQEAVRPL